jgi:hypothetical protein
MVRPRQQRRRDRQLNISLSEAEIDRLRQRAAAAEMRLVDYARALLLFEGREPAPPSVPQIDRLVYEQLKRLGNNLNQIARQLNAGRGTPPDLSRLLQDIRAVLNRGAMLGS